MNPQTPDNEVARLRPFGCKCQTLSERLVGDGCDECNKAFAIEMLADERDELTNEVARLRELLNRALECLKVYGGGLGVEAAKQISEELAPAPEEPTIEGVTMGEWYGGFAKIESTEPVIQNSRTTESDPVPTQPTTQNEWRELGPDEVICEGDEEEYTDAWGEKMWLKVVDCKRAGTNTRLRTRRPLPKQEEMPLEKEIRRIEWHQNYSDAMVHHAIADALRFLRDEIQKLKEVL
jgi:hypothetical protein